MLITCVTLVMEEEDIWLRTKTSLLLLETIWLVKLKDKAEDVNKTTSKKCYNCMFQL